MRSVVQIYLGPLLFLGAVAQLGERRPCKAEVIGSNPIFSTILDHNSKNRSVNRGRDKNLRAKGHMVDALAPNDEEGRG